MCNFCVVIIDMMGLYEKVKGQEEPFIIQLAAILLVGCAVGIGRIGELSQATFILCQAKSDAKIKQIFLQDCSVYKTTADMGIQQTKLVFQQILYILLVAGCIVWQVSQCTGVYRTSLSNCWTGLRSYNLTSIA